MNAVADTPTDAPTTRDKLTDFYDLFPYTGPGTLAGRYLRQFWHPVAVSADLKPGTAKPITVMSEQFTLFRGTSGAPYLLPYRCPHRGTQLSVGYIEGDHIRCLYHGWSFDAASGQCVDMPAEDPGQADKVTLKRWPVQEYLGLVWGWFGEGEPAAFPPFPAFDTEGSIHNNVEMFTHNYFQAWENDFDIYHAAFTHRTGGLHQIDYKSMMESETYEEKDFGIERHIDTGMGDMVSTMLMPCTVRLSIPLFNEEARLRGAPMIVPTYLIHVPIDDHGDHIYVIRNIPLFGAEFDQFVANFERMAALRRAQPSIHAVAADIRAGKLALKDVTDHPAFVLIEDLCAQGGQGVIADRHAERLGKSDRGVVFLRRLWARELGLLAQGKPTKAWTRPARLPRGTFGENRPR